MLQTSPMSSKLINQNIVIKLKPRKQAKQKVGIQILSSQKSLHKNTKQIGKDKIEKGKC